MALKTAVATVAVLLAAGCGGAAIDQAPTASMSSIDAAPHMTSPDTAKNVYVANTDANTVTVYEPGKSQLLRKISHDISAADALAFDGSGNLYVANGGASPVTVYPPAGTYALRTIEQGIEAPIALAFGSNHYLNVANSFFSITEYAPGSNKLVRKITKGINYPASLAFGP
ncbi:MAG: hypothetical protein JO104_00970 [Candidatus Eremiobacteraeota bacterium]|nr:hypothetical protein [Candidatus Eremiobacteraeota bacterium]